MWISEQTAIISLYSINCLVFITETECLLRGRDWVFKYNSSLNKILRSAHTAYLCVLCGSDNKQQLFPYTALTGWFFITETECLLRGTGTLYTIQVNPGSKS